MSEQTNDFEGINFVTVEDSTGGEYNGNGHHDKMSPSHLVLIIFACGAALTTLFLIGYMRYERLKRERLQAIKLGATSSGEVGAHTEASNASNFDLATPTTDCSENRNEIIENGVVVHNWPEDAKTPAEEQTTDEESQQSASSDTNTSCPICRKAFESGVEVCNSRSPSCRHTFHKSCIFNWLQYQSSCPVCNEGYLSHDSKFFQ